VKSSDQTGLQTGPPTAGLALTDADADADAAGAFVPALAAGLLLVAEADGEVDADAEVEVDGEVDADGVVLTRSWRLAR
jgi:hypothetical protein